MSKGRALTSEADMFGTNRDVRPKRVRHRQCPYKSAFRRGNPPVLALFMCGYVRSASTSRIPNRADTQVCPFVLFLKKHLHFHINVFTLPYLLLTD